MPSSGILYVLVGYPSLSGSMGGLGLYVPTGVEGENGRGAHIE